MKRIYLKIGLSLFMACILPASTLAQTEFVYTNNNAFSNTVSAFLIGPEGMLTELPDSPFPTDGVGSGGIAGQHNIIITGNLLYASNNGGSTVAGFSIAPQTGSLTLIPGSPFSLQTGLSGGTSLAVTPDGKFLLAANRLAGLITVFRIAADGSLAPITDSPFPIPNNSQMGAMKVTPNGKFLMVALFSGVAVYNIDANGRLSQVNGSPFLGIPGAFSLDFNCTSSRMFLTRGNFRSAEVDVFRIGGNGSISRIDNSPFQVGIIESQNLLLSPNGRFLFSSHAMNSITVSAVGVGGSLQVVDGSPFPVPVEDFNNGVTEMAINRNGTLLFAAVVPNLVDAFSVSSSGILTSVTGSPFKPKGVPSTSGLSSLAVYPAIVCRPHILNVVRDGKKLLVSGDGFEAGSVILLNGEKQKTKPDAENPESLLIGKKAGKKVDPGETVTIEVRWPNGTLSEPFQFTRPQQ